MANEGEDKVKKRTKGAVESMKNLDNKGAKKYNIRYKIIKQRSRKVDNEAGHR